MARPSKDNDEIKIKPLIIKLVENGVTIEDVAEILHINKTTIYEWKKKDPEFSNALSQKKQGTIQNELKKKITTKQIVAVLVKNAKGHHGVTTRTTYDENGRITSTVKTRQYYPPNQQSIDRLIELLDGMDLTEGDRTLTINLIRGNDAGKSQ